MQNTRPRFETVVVSSSDEAPPVLSESALTPSVNSASENNVPVLPQVPESSPVVGVANSSNPEPQIGSAFGVGGTTVSTSPPPVTGSPISVRPENVFPSSKGRGKAFYTFLTFLIPAFLILFAIFLVSFVMSEARKMSGGAVSTTPSPAPLVAATPVPTVAPILKYKRYMNPDAKVSLSYLSNFSLIECKGGVSFFFSPPYPDPNGNCRDGNPSIVFEYSDTSFSSSEDGPTPSKEELVSIDGIDSLAKHFEASGGVTKLISFSSDKIYYRIELLDPSLVKEFDDFVSRIKFVKSVTTEGWETYSNASGKFKFIYPPEMVFVASSSARVELSTPEGKRPKNTLVVETSANLSDAKLSALELVSSIRSLAGWVSQPTVDFQSVGNASVQILQGQKDGVWQVYAVFWYKTRLVQLVWTDDLSQGNQMVFDQLLQSFSFQ